MVSLKKIAVLSVLFASASAMSDPINVGTYTLLSGTDVVTFDELSSGFDPANPTTIGMPYNSIIISGGVAFGEHFSGQLLGTSGDFDLPSGVPTGPLNLLAGAPDQNLYVATSRVIDLPTLQFDNILFGVGPSGSANTTGLGEGSISVLFSSDQSQVGLQLRGLDGGNTYFSFFRADGSLIQTLTAHVADKSFVAFVRDGQVKDIRGVSIWNDDPNGMAIDNLKHDVASNVTAVPEMGTFSMTAAGLLALFAFAWRKQGRVK